MRFRSSSINSDRSAGRRPDGRLDQQGSPGLGAAILPGGCIQGETALRGLVARPFAEGGCRRAIAVCHSTSKTLSPAAVTMMGLVEKLAHERVAQGRWLGASLS